MSIRLGVIDFSGVIMSFFEKVIYEKLADLYSMSRWYVRTSVVAGHLAKNDRIVRGVLARLEAKGYIERRGERGGWKPTNKEKQSKKPVRAFPPMTAMARASMAAVAG